MKPVLLPLFGNDRLAASLARRLGAEIGKVELRRFPDQESYVRIDADVLGREVIIAGALDRPDNKFLSLIFLAATARDLGAGGVGLVCPYLPYMRQDTRFHRGEAVTATYFAEMLSGTFDWLVTVDPHLHRHRALSEIYAIPAAAVHAAPLIADWIRRNISSPLIVGPDAESEQWAASVARGSDAPHVVLQKVRTGDYSVEVSIPRIDEWRERTPVLIDDVVSTARTMIAAVKRLHQAGNALVHCVCVHGLFAGTAYKDLVAAGAGRIVSCNTVEHATNRIDVADVLAAGIRGFIPAAVS